MKIDIYVNEIIKRIKRINLFISNPTNYQHIENPFNYSYPQSNTYVWIDNDETT